MNHTPRLRRCLVAILSILAATVMGASAAAAAQGWRPAEVFVHDALSPGTNIDDLAHLTVDPLGNAFLSGGVDRYAVRPPSGPFGAVQTPPGADSTNMLRYSGEYPRFAFDAVGNGVMVYVIADPASGFRANLNAVYRPAGVAPVLPAPQSIGKVVFGKFHGAAVAMNDAGESVLAWVEPNVGTPGQTLKVAARPAGAAGQFDVAAAQSFPLFQADQDVYVAIDADGSAVVVWSDQTTIWHSTRSGSIGSFSAPAIVGLSSSLRPLVIASNRAGDTVTFWLDLVNGATPGAARSVAFASYRPHGSSFEAPHAVTPQPPEKWAATGGDAAVLADGTAVVAVASFEGQYIGCVNFQKQTYEQTAVFLSSRTEDGWSLPATVGLRSRSGTTDIAYDVIHETRLAADDDGFVLAYDRTGYLALGGYCNFDLGEQGTEVFAHFGQGTTAGSAVPVPGTANSGGPEFSSVVDVSMDPNGNVLFATQERPNGSHTLRIVPYEEGGLLGAGIASVTPLRLSIGTVISVGGDGFTSKPKAWLDYAGKKVSLKVAKGATPTQLTATLASIPNGANGAVTLNVLPKGTKIPLTFPGLSIELPTITSVAPAAEVAGNLVTITGTYFGTKKGHVLLGTKGAKVTSWTDTGITIKVPKRLAVGTALDVVVKNRAGTVTKVAAFTPS